MVFFILFIFEELKFYFLHLRSPNISYHLFKTSINYTCLLGYPNILSFFSLSQSVSANNWFWMAIRPSRTVSLLTKPAAIVWSPYSMKNTVLFFLYVLDFEWSYCLCISKGFLEGYSQHLKQIVSLINIGHTAHINGTFGWRYPKIRRACIEVDVETLRRSSDRYSTGIDHLKIVTTNLEI